MLRSYTINDAPALFAQVQQWRVYLTEWLPWVQQTTKVEHSLAFIEDSLHKAEVQEALALGIFYDNELIGGIGMHDWKHEIKSAQVGYWIAKTHEGKGIMYSSAAGFVDFLFNKVGLNKVELHYVTANIRSGRLAERLKFRLEGIIRQSIYRKGNLEDLVITGMLKSEWKAQG